MSLVDSPRVSLESVKDIPLEEQPRRPRRSETLPVRFENPSIQRAETFTRERQPQTSRKIPIPFKRPSYDRYPGLPLPPLRNPYQSYYEDAEDDYHYRSDVRQVPESQRYDARVEPIIIKNGHDDYEYENLQKSARGSRYPWRHRSSSPVVISYPPPRRRSRSPSPPYRTRTRVIERDRSRSRSGSPIHRGSRSKSHFNRADTYEDVQILSSAIEKDDLDTQTFSFTLSRQSKGLSDTSFGSISESSEKPESQEAEDIYKTQNQGKTRLIFKSQYVGDGLIGGHHSVQITDLPQPSPQSRKSLPAIFRWIHFEDVNMDFDQFQNNVGAITDLSDKEKSAISKLLTRAKKRYDKPLQTSRGMKSRYMLPSCLQEIIATEGRPKTSSRTRTASWICVPYFCLDNYSAPAASARPSSHPMRTLLQTRFSLTNKDRDMHQAVRLLPDPPAENFCFHIAQVWFIVLDDSLLVSCSRQSMYALKGEGISFSTKSLSNSQTSSSTNILVSARGSVLWSLPWFVEAFISHFWEYWPRTLEFSFHEKVITSEDWPRILVLASKTNIRLELDFKGAAKEPARGILLEDPVIEEDESESSGISKTEIHDAKRVSGPSSSSLKISNIHGPQKAPAPMLDSRKSEFSVFGWLNSYDESLRGAVKIIPPEIQYQQLEQDLREADDFMNHKTNLNEKLTYRACPVKTRLEVYRMLVEERQDITAEPESDQTKRKKYETKVDILNAGESLFQFFLPRNSVGPSIGKFWGGLFQILEEQKGKQRTVGPRNYQFDREDVLDWLKLLTRTTVPFRELFSQAKNADQSNIQIPEELTKAWLHLVMSIAFVAIDMQYFEEQMALCNQLIETGIGNLVHNMSYNPLSDYTTFVPAELASFITFQLIQDVTGNAIDICETYWEYIKVLQAAIEGNPLDRGHQDRVVFLQQEISVISETLEQQQKVLCQSTSQVTHLRLQRSRNDYSTPRISRSTGLRNQETVYYERDVVDADYSRHSPLDNQMPGLDPGGVQGLLAQDAIALIESRIKSFNEMHDQASDLAEWNIGRIDSNKDRQEAAIYAFTIVTIIFLPLSTVAGILGMNTYDVRNMSVDQWVFWATALPLTFLIVTLCLIWAGELNNFWEGFSQLWRRKPNNYMPLQDSYNPARVPYEREVVLRDSPRFLDATPRARRSHILYGGRPSYA